MNNLVSKLPLPTRVRNMDRQQFETIFDRFNPLSPEVWVNNDVPGILAFLEAALTKGPALPRSPHPGGGQTPR